ncbi:MAG: F0F1 ATP synthase subunit B [Immundisolibacterales bacterium]|nr:F0F1 ATP synthase subunit B [Immundisolibacterales bacterium]
MNVTATLFGQMGTFLVLVLFVMKFLWRPILDALEDRRKRIADGLAAAEQGHESQARAEEQAQEVLKEAREQASEIISQAQRRGSEIVEESKASARNEGERILVAARAEVDQESMRAREALRSEVGRIALVGAERLLRREVDADRHAELLGQLAEEL